MSGYYMQFQGSLSWWTLLGEFESIILFTVLSGFINKAQTPVAL